MLCHSGPLGDNTPSWKEGHFQQNVCAQGDLLSQTSEPALMDKLLLQLRGALAEEGTSGYQAQPCWPGHVSIIRCHVCLLDTRAAFCPIDLPRHE